MHYIYILTYWPIYIHTYPHTYTQECGSGCSCGMYSCKNRIASNSGLSSVETVLFPVFVMHVDDKAGFGLFNGCDRIRKGSVVMEYVGECMHVRIHTHRYGRLSRVYTHVCGTLLYVHMNISMR